MFPYMNLCHINKLKKYIKCMTTYCTLQCVTNYLQTTCKCVNCNHVHNTEVEHYGNCQLHNCDLTLCELTTISATVTDDNITALNVTSVNNYITTHSEVTCLTCGTEMVTCSICTLMCTCVHNMCHNCTHVVHTLQDEHITRTIHLGSALLSTKRFRMSQITHIIAQTFNLQNGAYTCDYMSITGTKSLLLNEQYVCAYTMNNSEVTTYNALCDEGNHIKVLLFLYMLGAHNTLLKL